MDPRGGGRVARRRSTGQSSSILVALGLAIALAACESGGGPDDGASPNPSGPPPDTAQVLRDLELSRLRALVEVDLPTLEELFAEEFEVVSPPGSSLDRDELLDYIENGEIDYLALEPVSEIDVRDYGDGAVLTYRSWIKIDVSGTGELAHESHHTVVYQQIDGDWQVVWEQATSIGGFPPA